MQEENPDGKKPPTLAISEKDPYMAVFYCGHRIAGGLCQQSQLAGGVDGHPRLQPDCPAQRRGAGDCQLFALRLL